MDNLSAQRKANHQKSSNDIARYPHIDALRAIAALLVIVLHVSEVFARLPEVRANGNSIFQLARAIDMGRLGVVIFFAISGFVICSSLKGPRLIATREFAIKRFLRLYPAYWLALPLGLWSIWYLWGRPITAELIWANLTMMPSAFGQENIMGLFWTLETELVFYLLCLTIFWTGLRISVGLLTAICLILLTLYAGYHSGFLPKPEFFGWLHMPYHLAIMFWGGIARICHDDCNAAVQIGRLKFSARTVLVSIALIMLIPMFAIAAKNMLTNGKAKDLHLFAAYSLGLLTFYLGCFHLKLRHPVFVWLGTISYSIYLFHGVVFTPMYWWARYHPQHPLAQLHIGVYLVLTIVLTIAFSHLVYRYLESPSNRLARHLVARLRTSNGTLHG